MEALTSYPELAQPDVQRPLAGVRYPNPSLAGTYEPGVTEPYIQQLVCALLVASGAKVVLETGGFLGITSAWLALTLEQMGGGNLTVCEIDGVRAVAIRERLVNLPLIHVSYTVPFRDVMEVIKMLPDDSMEFVWLDDDHQKDHVEAEISALWPKMKQGGLIVGHDVYGVCELWMVFESFGGYSINLPRLGPAGGIGIIQKP